MARQDAKTPRRKGAKAQRRKEFKMEGAERVGGSNWFLKTPSYKLYCRNSSLYFFLRVLASLRVTYVRFAIAKTLNPPSPLHK
jgi:hypothetical protein